jgi:hypothetical protein
MCIDVVFASVDVGGEELSRVRSACLVTAVDRAASVRKKAELGLKAVCTVLRSAASARGQDLVALRTDIAVLSIVVAIAADSGSKTNNADIDARTSVASVAP